MDADTAIRAIISRLPPSDVAYLLEARGLPARGGGSDASPSPSAVATLATALAGELVEWEWEAGDVGQSGYHAPITGAGGSLTVAGNALWAYGGLNGDRVQDAGLWRWDLGPAGAAGFEPVLPSTHSPPAPRLASGHYAAAGPDGRVWVFPGPRNPDLSAAWAFDPSTRVWEEMPVAGAGPSDPAARRLVACGVVEAGRALLALGGPAASHTVHRFDFRARSWGEPAHLAGGPPSEGWLFGGAAVQGTGGSARLVMWGALPGGTGVATPPRGGGGGEGGAAAAAAAPATPSPSPSSDDGPPVELYALDWAAKAWTRLPFFTPPPPLRTHAAGAVVGDRLILQGGRRPGPFNVTAAAWEFDFRGGAWHPLFASDTAGSGNASTSGPAAREWHAAAGLADCAVFVGGRTGIPPYEPVPVTPDAMSAAVDILWVRKGDSGKAGTSAKTGSPPIGRAAMLAALAGHDPAAAAALPLPADPTPDVLLLAGDAPAGPVPFRAHRFVLAAHSTVFAAMWGSGMREGGSCGGTTTNPSDLLEVALPDVSPPTASALLAYCYASTPTLPASVPELRALYEAGDKYDMPGLVREVLGALRTRVGAGDLASLLALADARHSAPLRSVCADAAARSLPDLLASPSFAALVTGAPELGLGLISEVVAKLGVVGLSDGKGKGDEAGASTSSSDEEENEEGDADLGNGEERPHLSPRGGAVEEEEEEQEEEGEEGEEGRADLPSIHPTPPASPRGGGGAPAPPTPGQ